MKIPQEGHQGHVYAILALLAAYSGEQKVSRAKQRIGEALREILDDDDKKPEEDSYGNVHYPKTWLHRLEAAVDGLRDAGFLERGRRGFWIPTQRGCTRVETLLEGRSDSLTGITLDKLSSWQVDLSVFQMPELLTSRLVEEALEFESGDFGSVEEEEAKIQDFQGKVDNVFNASFWKENQRRLNEFAKKYQERMPEKPRVTPRLAKKYETTWGEPLKSCYEYTCQVSGCGFTFRQKSGKGYAEAHHLEHLADDGLDIPENIVILCANCHRQMHYAEVELVSRDRDKLTVKINGVTKTINMARHPQIHGKS